MVHLSPSHNRSPATAAQPAFALAALLTVVALTAMPAPAQAYRHSQHDVVVFGNEVTIPKGDDVGDVVVFGGSADVYGHVHGDAVVIGGYIHIEPDGQVDGDKVVLGGSIADDSERSGARQGPSEVPTPEAATPAPPIERRAPAHAEREDVASGQHWFLAIVSFLSILAFALFPARARATHDSLVERPMLAGLLGFLWPFVLPTVLIVLAISILGIPLIPIALVAFALAYLLGKAALSLFVGRRFFEVAKVLEPSPLASVAIGLLTIGIVESVLPPPGGIILDVLVVGSMAVGAVAVTFLRKRETPGAPPLAFTPPVGPATAGPPAVPN